MQVKLFMNHWALKWRLDPNIISVWSISSERKHKLCQVDTKYNPASWLLVCSQPQLFLLSLWGQLELNVKLVGGRREERCSLFERLLMRRKIGRLFPSIISPRLTDSARTEGSTARSTFHFIATISFLFSGGSAVLAGSLSWSQIIFITILHEFEVAVH